MTDVTQAIDELVRDFDLTMDPAGDGKFRIGVTLPRDALVMWYGAVSAKMREDPKTAEVTEPALEMIRKKLGIFT